MRFTATAALLAVAIALVRGDVATVKADVAKIDSAVSALNQRLAANNIGYLEALGINSAAGDLDNQIKQGTSDVKANTETVTDADATDIINTLTGTEVNVKKATDRLVVLKPKFDGLGVTGLAQGTIKNLATDTHTFGQALVGASPASQQTTASALAAKFDTDLATAQQAYA